MSRFLEQSTIAYYDNQAASFFAETITVDMSEHYERFLDLLPKGGLILDAGCGSGRDSKSFLDRGYRIRAFDGSAELARMAAELIGLPVQVRRFEQVDEKDCYDGIWVSHLRDQALTGLTVSPVNAFPLSTIPT